MSDERGKPYVRNLMNSEKERGPGETSKLNEPLEILPLKGPECLSYQKGPLFSLVSTFFAN